MTIRTILVDDEPLAIQGLELRLAAHDDVEIIAKCQNGREAISAIKTHKPDLVFLDIQMPGLDAFSVVQGLLDVEPPLFVFVTAYSDHAIRAFEAQATDYLMKPVEEARLADTLKPMLLTMLVDVALLAAWSGSDPLQYERTRGEGDYDAYGYPLRSFGMCASPSAWAFVSPLVALHVLLLCYANWTAYVTREVKSEYQEVRRQGARDSASRCSLGFTVASLNLA